MTGGSPVAFVSFVVTFVGVGVGVVVSVVVASPVAFASFVGVGVGVVVPVVVASSVAFESVSGVTVGVDDGVTVGVGVGVDDGVAVGVGVGVDDGVAVGVGVGVDDGVAVGVGIVVCVGVGAGVDVGVEAADSVCAASPDGADPVSAPITPPETTAPAGIERVRSNATRAAVNCVVRGICGRVRAPPCRRSVVSESNIRQNKNLTISVQSWPQ
ncbi:hypothetical protein [Salinigranum marinum]|uniref:hypothetical protein n=1 Tax=Salinigranum marinum TaxID=1515595 RepID=UPI002989C72E|nr:hypothetical protein [Salinigranum marinum]